MASASSLPSSYTDSSGAVPVYQSATELYKEIRPQWAKIIKHVGIQLKPPKAEAQRGFDAYMNAMSSHMPIVLLGAENMREDMELIYNMGTLATDPQVDIKDISKHIALTHDLKPGKPLKMQVERHVKAGAIVNDSNWWIFRNDLFMLGAIHAGKEFHISYAGIKPGRHGIPPREVLWDDKNKRPRALGREILMLAASGFTPKFFKRGLSFVPPVINNRYTYTQMKDIVEKCQPEMIDRYLAQAARFALTPSPSPSPPSSLTPSLEDLSATLPSPRPFTAAPPYPFPPSTHADASGKESKGVRMNPDSDDDS